MKKPVRQRKWFIWGALPILEALLFLPLDMLLARYWYHDYHSRFLLADGSIDGMEVAETLAIGLALGYATPILKLLILHLKQRRA